MLRGFRDGSVANLPPAGELGPTIREWLAHFTPVVRPPLRADASELEGKDSRTQKRKESNSARAEPRRESSSRGQTLASFARKTWSGVSDQDLSKDTFKISISGGGKVQAARAMASAEVDGRHVSIRADCNVAMQMQLDRAKSATVAVAPLYKKRAEVLDAESQMKAMATEKAKKLNPYLSTPRFLEICDYCGSGRQAL